MCVASDLVPYIARENPSDTRIFFDRNRSDVRTSDPRQAWPMPLA